MVTFKDSIIAFQEAIDNGDLSANPASPMYAGKWMYMHTSADGKHDQYKNINTRRYINFLNRALGV